MQQLGALHSRDNTDERLIYLLPAGKQNEACSTTGLDCNGWFALLNFSISSPGAILGSRIICWYGIYVSVGEITHISW